MPAETKTAAAAETETPTKGKKQATNNSKAALARISLLDGSILDVTIDVSISSETFFLGFLKYF